ncbi:cation:proton antiporter regulatory subunit [Planctomycetota bacterium]
MVAVIVFVGALVVSWIIVRIGAIAFQLTGLEWSLAKFQSLSCFSGTGFTTRESELIVSDRRRRRIASVLMVLGNAGLVTLIATAASALNPDQTLLSLLENGTLNTMINLAVLGIVLFLVYKILNNKKITGKLTRYLRKKIKKKELFKPVSFEELLQLTGGYGITRIEVSEGSPLIDKALFESELRQKDITVLAIIRDNETIPNPSANRKIQKGDGLISFGNLENIRNQASHP